MSAFAKGNARGCAKLASMLANKGEGLMSEKAWNEMHSEPLKETAGALPGKIPRPLKGLMFNLN